jgi:hypothetical protein
MKGLRFLCAVLLAFAPSAISLGSDMDCDSSTEKAADCPHSEIAGARDGAKKKWNGRVLTRGRQIAGGPTVTLAELFKSPESRDGETIVVAGTVRRACERRGCWMELAEGKAGPGVRVTFKDYGFFVPIDSAGTKAKVAGTVKSVELSQELAAHYKSEGATIPTDSTGKAREIEIVADGVELRR